MKRIYFRDTFLNKNTLGEVRRPLIFSILKERNIPNPLLTALQN